MEPPDDQRPQSQASLPQRHLAQSLTWELRECSPQQIHVILLTQVLTGQAAFCFYCLLLARDWEVGDRSKKSHAENLEQHPPAPTPYLPLPWVGFSWDTVERAQALESDRLGFKSQPAVLQLSLSEPQFLHKTGANKATGQGGWEPEVRLCICECAWPRIGTTRCFCGRRLRGALYDPHLYYLAPVTSLIPLSVSTPCSAHSTPAAPVSLLFRQHPCLRTFARAATSSWIALYIAL